MVRGVVLLCGEVREIHPARGAGRGAVGSLTVWTHICWDTGQECIEPGIELTVETSIEPSIELTVKLTIEPSIA